MWHYSAMLRIVVLISGRGSNLLKLLEEQGEHYIVEAVISNNPQAPGLQYAIARGIHCFSFPCSPAASSAGEGKAEQKAKIYSKLAEFSPDLVCLAGFMQIVPANVVEDYRGRLINIHPSLLPAFPGLHTHRQALAAKVRRHGCTVHLVDSGVDTGAIIAQAELEIAPNDDENNLNSRVLALEHRLYPWVVKRIADNSILIAADSKIEFTAAARDSALRNGFKLG